MAPSPTVAYSFEALVSGVPLSDANNELLASITVDNSLNLPDMAVLEFNDPRAQLLGAAGMIMGASLTIKVTPDGGTATTVFVGEITALEAHYDGMVARTVVRAYDKSNRLMRGRQTKAWVQMCYSDIVSAIASAAGLEVGQVDSTSPVYTQVSQANVEDWHFLRYLADQVGYRLAVVEGKLEFTKPVPPTAGETPTVTSTDPLSYCPGDPAVIRIRAAVTSAGQVAQASATGWNPTTKQAVSSQQSATANSAVISSFTASGLAGQFSADPFEASWSSIDDSASAQMLAAAAANQIASAFAEVEAEVVGNPALYPGVVVNLGGIGKLSGSYTLSSTRHVYDRHLAYRTEFTVSDRQDRSLLGLVSGGGGAEPEVRQMPSVVTAIVTNVNDTDSGMCRVKLKFPWLSDDYESDWARTLQLGAGASRGFQVLPEANDEVLVAFEQGDFGSPMVLGGLHNGVDAPPMAVGDAVADGLVVQRMFKSRTGHTLVFQESDSQSTISLISMDNKTELILDSKAGKVTLQAAQDIDVIAQSGQVSVSGPTGVTVKSNANISVEAGGNLTLKATGQVQIQGATVDIQGQGQVQVQGATVSVQGEGEVQVQGAIVQIN